jgi:hypothetical protein
MPSSAKKLYSDVGDFMMDGQRDEVSKAVSLSGNVACGGCMYNPVNYHAQDSPPFSCAHWYRQLPKIFPGLLEVPIYPVTS